MIEESIYVLMTSNGKYIAIDYSSGGYPYEVESFAEAVLFRTPELVAKYNYMFRDKEFKVYNVIIELVEVLK